MHHIYIVFYLNYNMEPRDIRKHVKILINLLCFQVRYLGKSRNNKI